MLANPLFLWKTARPETSHLPIPLAAFLKTLTNQNLLHTIHVPCFMLVESVALSGYQKAT
jgi:hypothetical protein